MGKAGKRILFSRKDDWEPGIRSAIGSHSAHFHDLADVDAGTYDLVVPLTVEAARHFNQRHGHLNRVKALVPSDHAIELCDDKHSFARHLAQAGFGRFLPRAGDGLPHPYLLKKRIAEWGMHIHVIGGVADELAHAERLRSCDYIKQEYVCGRQEYTTHMLMSRGRTAFMRTLEFTFADDLFVKGKSFSPASQACVDHSRFSALFEAILNCVGFQGFCCFNYKLVEGQPRIFEVNPRYGASLTGFLGEAITSLWQALPARTCSLRRLLRVIHTRV